MSNVTNMLAEIDWRRKFRAVQSLNANGNSVSKISGLEDLTALEHLDLSSNRLVRIEGLMGLTSLRRLELRSNRQAARMIDRGFVDLKSEFFISYYSGS